MSQISTKVTASSVGAVTEFVVSSGTSPVVPNGSGQITLNDGNNISWTGGANAMTADVTGTTEHAVQVGSGAGALTSLALGTAGQVLTSNGAGSDPSWQDAVSANLAITTVNNAMSAYTVLAADQVLLCDSTTGVITINLPNTTDTGRRVWIKDSGGDASSSNITLTTPGGTVTIDGSTSVAMNTDFQSVTVIFDGTNYSIL